MARMPIRAQLQAESTWLRRRRVLLSVIGAALIFGLPIVALALVDGAVVFRETTAFFIVAAAAIAAVIWFIVRLVGLRRAKLGERDVAIRVENACPEFMDSLICAAELLAKPKETLNSLNHALIRRVEADVAKRNLHQIILRGELATGIVLAMCVLALGLLGGAHFTPLAVKARAHARDLVAGTSSALRVKPGDTEVARGDDLQLSVKVNRGPTDKVLIILNNRKGRQEYRMTPDPSGLFTFEMYGVHESFTYQILTPTVASKVFRVHVYQRPEISDPLITVTPPRYTGLPVDHHKRLLDLVVPEGSAIKLEFTGNMPMTAVVLLDDEEPIAFQRGAGERHGLTIIASRNTRYVIRLMDSAGHAVDADVSHSIEVIEDFAPLVRITTPEEDSSRQDKDDDVPIVAQITDDYAVGSATLKVNVNGNGWREFTFRLTPGTEKREVTGAEVLKLDGIVEHGDVVTYYVEARDGAEPKPHVGRSDIRFLEIRPPPAPPREQEGGGEGNEQQKLTVADLIVGVKHFIKQTFELDTIRDESDREERMEELTRAVADLHLSARKRFAKIKKVAEEKKMNLGKFEKFFDETVRDLGRSRDLMEKRLPAESANYAQSALGSLVKIEIELEKNRKKRKGKGKGKGKSEQEQVAEKNEETERNQKLEDLQAVMRKLDRLIDRQDVVNRRIDGLKGDAGNQRDLNYAKQKENALASDTDNLRTELRQKVPEGYTSALELSRSAEQMRNAARRLQSGQPGTATKHARQATGYLRRARKKLEELRKQLAGRQLQEAISDLNQLRKDQQGVKDETGKEAGKSSQSREALRDLADKQNKLHEQYQELLRKLEKAAEQSEQSSPGSSEAISQAVRKAEQQQTGRDMKRAANALRYRRADRAEQEQEMALNGLKALAQNLADAQQKGGQPSPEELGEMLSKVLKDHQDLKDAAKLGEKENRELMNRSREDMKEVSAKLRDSEMKKIGNEVDGIGDAAGQARMRELLQRTARVLERKLFEEAIRRKVKLGRVQGRQAPDAYRKLVKEYFKSLSELDE